MEHQPSDNKMSQLECVSNIDPVVKITVSPNTPSPEPSDCEQSESFSSETDLMDRDKESDKEKDKSQSSSASSSSSSAPAVRNNNNNNSSVCRGGGSGDSQIQNYTTTTTKLSDLFSASNTSSPVSKDVPICIDFGIQDYLCRVEETEFDLSSDTDTNSYLGATPPHRFSDGEIDPIEAMPVLLDTPLNLNNDHLLTQSDVDEITKKLSLSWKDNENFHTFLGKSLSKESLFSLHLSSPQSLSYNKMKAIQERRLSRPFRRNISLPAAIFKSYLLEQQQQQQQQQNNQNQQQQIPEFNRQLKEESKSSFLLHGENNKPTPPRLSRIESISNSSQLNLDESRASCESESLTNSIDDSNWNISNSLDSDGGPDDMDNQPFSKVERQGLMMRFNRRLIRQDTAGNFAPPEFCIP